MLVLCWLSAIRTTDSTIHNPIIFRERVHGLFSFAAQKIKKREMFRETILIEMSNEVIFSTFQTIPSSLLKIERGWDGKIER